jgi:hypothetical protein
MDGGITISITKDGVHVSLGDASCAGLTTIEPVQEHFAKVKLKIAGVRVLFFNRLKVMCPYSRDGRGKELLGIVTRIADANGFAICCTPSPYPGSPLNFDQLVALYKRYGFEEAGTTGCFLMRYPKKVPERELSLEEKRELYRIGKYKFKAPPVHSSGWREDDWIRFIDAYGGWLRPTTKRMPMQKDDFTVDTWIPVRR